jgi:hypothetical protein
MIDSMYAHTCSECGDTGIVLFSAKEIRIDPCACPPSKVGV